MLNIVRKITPSFLLSWYHFLWAFLGAVLYGFPSRNLRVIGVTGTDGKSTTVEMTAAVLAASGAKVAFTSSVWFQIGERRWKNALKMGMPGRFFLQKFLRQAAKEGCQYAVIETSSEGMLQHRHRFIRYRTAVITNLSPEHIEHHGSFENYRATKEKLFLQTKEVHVVNADDEHAPFFIRHPSRSLYTFGIGKAHPKATKHLRADNIQEEQTGTSFLVEGVKIRLRLLGSFNVMNALAALCVAAAEGISVQTAKQGLEAMERVPGRMDPILKEPFTVLVDYAVTPKALENLYKTVQRIYKPKRIIAVLGSCGGGRDRWKRPVLGKIAADHCAHVILTNEDPYEEDPKFIVQEIQQGAKEKGEIILDRREAIKSALSLAKENDLVVITGKGSEDSMAIAGGKKISWDDREVVREEWTKLKNYGKI